MTSSEQPPTPDQQPGATFDQRGQPVYGSQTNIAGAVNTGGGIFNAGTINFSSPASSPPYDAAAELVAHASPEDFVGRATQYDQVRRWLLDPRHAPIAMVGPGGFGKTTLVQALCQDPAVRNHFKDGLRWVQLAEEPSDLLSVISDLVVRLGRPRPDFRTLENATTALIEALGDQTLLLVIDNVWRATELAPLLKGGPNCVRLMTTRDGSLAPASANILDLDVMTEVEAVQLLTAHLPAAANLAAAELARQLYYWPLLLRLINSALHDRLTHEGLPLVAAWQSIRQDLIDFGMTAFDDPKDAADRDRAVRASLNISLNQLSPAERACYGQLAIFPAAAIHWSALSRLWHMNLAQTRDLCRKLRTLSLVYLNEATRTIRLHDVFRGYLQNEQAANLVTLHQMFLSSYGLKHWTDLPADEPYLWDQLAYHLIAAERSAELTDLFADDRWLQVRVAHDGYTYDGYIADLTHAWQLAHTAVHRATDAGTGSVQLAACVHYALIRTTINALAANYHPALIARAVETGLWTFDRALSIAYRVPDTAARAAMLITLLVTKYGNPEQRVTVAIHALGAIFSLQSEGGHAELLAALAPHLTTELLEQGLVATLSLNNEEDRAETLAALAPYLTSQQSTPALKQELATALARQRETGRVEALAALAPHLTTNLLEQGLVTVRTFQHEGRRTRALAALAPYLTGNLLEQGLTAALALQSERSRTQALAALAPYLTGQQHTLALAQGLSAALALCDEGSRTQPLAALAPYLTTDLLERRLIAALTLQDEKSRSQALAALAPYLTGELLEQGLTAALALRDEWDRAKVLAALAPHLTGQQHILALEQGLTAAFALQDEGSRTQALAALAPHLTGELLEQGLTAALALRDEWDRARVLVALAPYLTGELLEQGLTAAFALQDEGSRTQALAALAPHLTGELLEQGLTAALAPESAWNRVKVLVALAPYLTGELLERGLTAAFALQDEGSRAQAVAALAPYLTGELLERGLTAALALQDKEGRAGVLAALAPHLTTDLLEQKLAAILALESEWGRTKSLLPLLMHMPDRWSLRHAMQTTIAHNLWRNLQLQPRSAILEFLSDQALFSVSITDPGASGAIAQSVIDICWAWRWL